MTTNQHFEKRIAAVLEWKFDWRALTNGSPGGDDDWLAAGETITAGYTITASPTGTGALKIDSSARTDSNTSITVWLSAGVNGVTYTVTCHIVTNAGRTDDRTIYIYCKSR